ncbi:DMT family transporter [Thiomicrorhabdus xiamenensis]|uniref:DMT family transporter n=1 Tax=Thiomicrorhabdus xiamenensis TaxID=2739063 RepID=A0A7D4SY61_9GAMM|nr:DMT family transporter [Thiomicrorhabdus xiamenensis]QKI88784.1 DMT family transporter [Thiomicrorhabdus xiamenensis]
MISIRVLLLAALAMIAFAANSLLCRIALTETTIDAASFTTIRLVSGAVMLFILWKLLNYRQQPRLAAEKRRFGGNTWSALALFVYAAGFSFAYIELSAATGALLLFGAVQLTMIGYGLYKGERLNVVQLIALALAVIGMLVLLLPGASSPSLSGAVLMTVAGIAWGVYSLRGRSAQNAHYDTSGNFIRALPLAVLLSLLWIDSSRLDQTGVVLAIASGALASGIGYAVWYAVVPFLSAASAAILQLSVPPLTALGAVVFLDESITLRFTLASVTILGGVALFIVSKNRFAAR